MAKPSPLTQTPAADLNWSRPQTPVATKFEDIYFSTDGGLDETRTVFLRGCGLPERWKDTSVFTIAELGFGSGLNFLATWQKWAETAQSKQRLHFVSIEKFPFDREQLQRALSSWPELNDLSAQLLAQWPGRVKGMHRLNFGTVTLTLIHADVIEAFDQLDGLKADAWFLDGFSPSGNPAMWSGEVMQHLASCCAAGARLATFSVAGSVRAALKDAGFTVRKMPGFGRKRHRLEADFPGQRPKDTQPIENALIVGAGIAGRSLARALTARHIAFDIIDDHAHPAASTNPAALVKGYALNLNEAALVGATHDRLDDRDPFEIRPEDDDKNLSALAEISGKRVEPVNRPSRASVRVTSRDTLPILSKINEAPSNNVWAMTGLGSRGFTFAPLLAEALISHLCHEIGPLDKNLRGTFIDSKRFTNGSS